LVPFRRGEYLENIATRKFKAATGKFKGRFPGRFVGSLLANEGEADCRSPFTA
jgi:hypothetical protein